MSKYILGLDVNYTFLAAVVIEQRGKERQIISCDSIVQDRQLSLSENLTLLLEKISWKGGSCICGIPLSDISIRNLTIPFADKKKINQVLSFELEDQLLSPVSKQIVEYVDTGQTESATHILVTAIEKEKLSTFFAALEQCNIRPDVLGLRLVALAEQTPKINKKSAGIIFLDAGLQSINILFCQQGEVVFLRHLPYPEKMIIASPFNFSEGRAGIINHQEAMECITSICRDINRSLGFFNLENGLELSADKIVLTGCIGQIEEFQEKIQTELGIPVVLSNVREEAGILLGSSTQVKWNPVFHDFALCLAMEGLKKRHLINFRKDEFSPQQMFFASKGRLLAASIVLTLLISASLIYLGLDYHSLNTRYQEIGGQMQALFKETFPDRTKIRDPLVEMQASIRNIQAPSVAIPVFTGDKRTLNILADISGRIPSSIEIQVSRLVIDQESVQVKGTTNTFNNVNIIQNNMRKSPFYKDVSIISAAADKDSKMIRFELRMETGGA